MKIIQVVELEPKEEFDITEDAELKIEKGIVNISFDADNSESYKIQLTKEDIIKLLSDLGNQEQTSGT